MGRKGLFRRWGIRQKIGYGYALAIGLATVGTLTGRWLESNYREKFKEQLTWNTEKAYLLASLNNAVLEARVAQQELIPLVAKPAKFKEQLQTFLAELDEIIGMLEQAKEMGNRSKISDSSLAEQTELLQLHKFASDYANALKNYSQELTLFLEDINLKNLQPEQVEALQNTLFQFSASGTTLKLNDFSHQSAKLANQFRKGATQAVREYEEADILGAQILMVSLLVSCTMAIILALFTSRAIAHPIEITTKVAQQVTQESKFDLQAPVITEDEIGLLTITLNQLIQRVGEHTGELSQKNLQLQRAHDQLSQVLSDLQQTQAQLIQTEKMSSLGQMVAGVAHEINNPVSFIHGNLAPLSTYIQALLNLINLYQQKCPNSSPEIEIQLEEMDLDFMTKDIQKILSSMKGGTERIRQIVLSLRNFSRLDEAEVKPANLHEGLENTLLILNHHINLVGIKIVKRYENIPLFECYAAQINQVFMNLFSNAIDALAELKSTETPTISIHTHYCSEPSEQVEITIRDNGSGIAPEIKEKIFDPFFTTKPVGKGTGLGLYICYQIIKNHHGQIEVSSELGKGTEFLITLPIKGQRALETAI